MILSSALADYDIKYSDIKFIIYAIQHWVNDNTNFTYEVDKRRIKLNRIINKTIEIKKIIDGIIIDQKKILRDTIHCKIETNRIIESLPDVRIIEYLNYFYIMLKEINKYNVRGFPIVPQFKTNIKYFRFDSRSLCDIYQEWKNCKVGTQTFKTNYKKYFDEMFSIRDMKKYKNTLKRYPNIRSISTDGYATTILFEKLKIITYTPKSKETKEKEKTPMKKRSPKNKVILKDLKSEVDRCTNNSKGRLPTLFDARHIKTTQEYLNEYDIAGDDPGNERVAKITTSSGKHITINKGYVNDLGHVTRNKELLERHKNNNPSYIETLKALTVSKKMAGVDNYMKYVKTICDNWINIWKYNDDQYLLGINFNSYVFKGKAYSRIAREIVEAIKNDRNIYKRHEKYFDREKFNDNKNKPIMIAIGTGNGSGTITNTKGSTPKGAIKRLMHELSKLVVVIATPEQNTSKLCCFCHAYLEGVDTYAFNTKKKYDDDKYEQSIEDRIFLTKELTHIIHEDKQEKYEKSIGVRDNLSFTSEEIEKTKEELFQLGCYNESYRLHRCANKHCFNTNRPILIERDTSASMNMPQIMKMLVTTQQFGVYAKKSKK